jgi:homoserine O-succinyltransferase
LQIEIVNEPHRADRRLHRGGGDACNGNLEIGLINLMPPAAMRRTEAEFRSLLRMGAEHSEDFSLRCFTHHDDGPMDFAGRVMAAEPLEALWDARLDGLIVTGAEPKAESMADEPLLPVLRQIVQWGQENTRAVMFSCFAAHAAVWCLDEIPRERLSQKLSGVFDCEKSADHPISAFLPDRWRTPHSRYNTLDEDALRDAGYGILSRGARLGADMFVKTCGNSEFLFVQGHPEYGAEVLLAEYCRDLKRFESGVSAQAPNWPEAYLEEGRVEASKRLVRSSRFEPAWRHAAFCMMDGWKGFLADRLTERHRVNS